MPYDEAFVFLPFSRKFCAIPVPPVPVIFKTVVERLFCWSCAGFFRLEVMGLRIREEAVGVLRR